MKRFLVMSTVLCCSMVCFGQPVGIFTDQVSVGSDAGAGTATFQNGVYQIEGSGNDIWGVPDGFYWIYKEITGDFTATATVEWLTGVDTGDEWKKAGILARNTADDPSRDDRQKDRLSGGGEIGSRRPFAQNRSRRRKIEFK